MNVKFTLFLFSCFAFASLTPAVKAQTVSVNDSLALVDLYSSTNGPGWGHHDNWLTGPVNTWYGITVKNKRVNGINLGINNLNGVIPASIGNLTNLQSFNCELNHLNGEIPVTIGNLTKLTALSLLQNDLTGKIPDTIGSLINLSYLNLSVNQLTDTIPASIGNLVKLTDLYLSDNPLTGSIPPSLGNLTKLTTLNLRNCKYSGKIPSSFGHFAELVNFYLDHNELTGQVPASLIGLQHLNWIDLSSNQLTFKKDIDPSLASYIHAYFSISFNRFTFDGIEALAGSLTYYSPQAPIKLHKNGNIFSVSAGGTLSNNLYYWYKVGRKSRVAAMAGDSTFQPTESGRYYAYVLNTQAYKLTLGTDTVRYTATSKAPLSITLYPNPVRGMLTISGLDSKRTNSIIIADINGTILIKATARNQSSVNYDVSKLKPGNYVLSLNDGEEIRALNFVKD